MTRADQAALQRSLDAWVLRAQRGRAVLAARCVTHDPDGALHLDITADAQPVVLDALLPQWAGTGIGPDGHRRPRIRGVPGLRPEGATGLVWPGSRAAVRITSEHAPDWDALERAQDHPIWTHPDWTTTELAAVADDDHVTATVEADLLRGIDDLRQYQPEWCAWDPTRTTGDHLGVTLGAGTVATLPVSTSLPGHHLGQVLDTTPADTSPLLRLLRRMRQPLWEAPPPPAAEHRVQTGEDLMGIFDAFGDRWSGGDQVTSREAVGEGILGGQRVPAGTRGRVVRQESTVFSGDQVTVEFENGYNAVVRPSQLKRRGGLFD